jgi:hypothetical protein
MAVANDVALEKNSVLNGLHHGRIEKQVVRVDPLRVVHDVNASAWQEAAHRCAVVSAFMCD